MHCSLVYVHSFCNVEKGTSHFCLRCSKCGREVSIEAKNIEEAIRLGKEDHSDCHDYHKIGVLPILAFVVLILLLAGGSFEQEKISSIIRLIFGNCFN